MKAKILFLGTLLFILALCLTGCADENDAFRKAEENGLTCRVTYELGDGRVNGESSLLYLVKPGALLPEPGVASGTVAPSLAGYRLTGYYRKNADGTTTPWDFANDRADADVTLYAEWQKNFTVQIFYGEGNGQSYSVSVSTDKPTLATFRTEKWSGHTFYGFYYDAEYTRPVEFPYTHALDPENTTETVYAKYLDGTYTIIRTAADFKSAINAGTKYYLDADIDLTGTKFTVADTFSGMIVGNGHTITGLTVTREQTKTSDAYGLFNRIAATAVIKDVTFADISVTVTLGNEQNNMISHIGAFAGGIADGAQLSDVSVSGALTYDCMGRDLTETLVVGAAFGEESDVDTTTFTCTATVSEKVE